MITIDSFLYGVTDWNNHLPLMWYALEETGSGNVFEFGCGDGSTRQLNNYCKEKNRNLFSFDTNMNWITPFEDCKSEGHKFTFIEKTTDWDNVKDTFGEPSVILIDHGPGERRIEDVKIFKDIKGILVLHDTQPQPTAAAYGWDHIWDLFKYRIDLEVTKMSIPRNGDNRTWAAAVSNHYDVTKWKGNKTNNPDYVIR